MLLNTFANSAIRGIKHEDEDDWKSMQATSFVDRFSLFQIRDMSSLFIDLIHAASGRWVNWCPSATGGVGAFGRFDTKSGEFQEQGNIYHLKSADGQFLYTGKPERSAVAREYHVNTSDVTCRQFVMDLDQGTLVGIRGQWQFSSKRGAFLVMLNYHTTSLPDAVKNAVLHSEDSPIDSEDTRLANLKLVTRTYSCEAYTFYLSNKSKELVNIGLAVQPPTPTALAATVGPVLNSKGEVLRKERRAEFKSAVTENHQPDLTPLFETENIRGPRRRR